MFINNYMIWFAGVVTVCFLAALFARGTSIAQPNGLRMDPLPNPLGFVIVAAAFGIFSGLRNAIGDTESYMFAYRLMDLETMDPIPFRLVGNSMFQYLQYQLRLMTEDPFPLIMINALAAVIPAVYILYRYASPFEMAVALFVLTGYYTSSMNGVRQYTAAGLLLLGTRFLFSDKWYAILQFLPFVVAAWTFHTTALVMIPVFLLVRRPAWSPLTLALLAGAVIATLAFDSFLPSFLEALEDTNYAQYSVNGWFTDGIEQGSSFIRVIVLSVPLVLAYLWHPRLHAIMGRKWDILVNLTIFNLVFYILSLYNWLFARLAIYTSIYVIIMMTHLLSKGVPEDQRRFWYPSTIGLYIGYFYNMSYTIVGYHSRFF